MKKVLIALATVIIAGRLTYSGYQLYRYYHTPLKTSQNIITYYINKKPYHLLLARKSDEWAKGLMNYRTLEGADGMLFIFPDKQLRTFWNKDTFMDLKLYWLDDDTVVGTNDLPSVGKSGHIVLVSSPSPINKVVELVQGY